MSDWININDEKPLPGQPITAVIDYMRTEIEVAGMRATTEPTVVVFPFYSGTGAEVILRWKPRALTTREVKDTLGWKPPTMPSPARNETQESITLWARETFGDTHPGFIARRAGKELEELIEVFDKTGDCDLLELSPQTLRDIGEECADVIIMVLQVAELCGTDVQEAINRKMAVNRERRWAYDPEKGQVQHVTKFKATLCGLDLQLDRWYLMERGGTWCVFPAGFETAEAALECAKHTRAAGAWGQVDVGVVHFDQKNKKWADGPEYTFVVVRGRDLYDHQTS